MDGLFLWCVVVPAGLSLWLCVAGLAVSLYNLIRQVF